MSCLTFDCRTAISDRGFWIYRSQLVLPQSRLALPQSRKLFRKMGVVTTNRSIDHWKSKRHYCHESCSETSCDKRGQRHEIEPLRLAAVISQADWTAPRGKITINAPSNTTYPLTSIRVCFRVMRPEILSRTSHPYEVRLIN